MFLFTKITSLDHFKRELLNIDTLLDLNKMREIVLGFKQRKDKHALNQGEKYGFSQAFKALDSRADQLGFKKYSGGYYKPLVSDGQKT